MNKPDIDKTRMTLAIEVTERACAKLAKQAHPQKKASSAITCAYAVTLWESLSSHMSS